MDRFRKDDPDAAEKADAVFADALRYSVLDTDDDRRAKKLAAWRAVLDAIEQPRLPEHNHYRTDGGPEWTGAEHDRWYPDCPLAGQPSLPTRSEVEGWFNEVGPCDPQRVAEVLIEHGGANFCRSCRPCTTCGGAGQVETVIHSYIGNPPERVIERCSVCGGDGRPAHTHKDPEPEVDPPTFYDAYKAEIDKVEIKGDMPAAAVYGECLRAAKRANDRINQAAENG